MTYKYTSVSDNELKHYGVPGMKWGVRRARKQLGSGTKSGHNMAVNSLNRHASKIGKKISSLDSDYAKLEKKRNKQISSSDIKAAKMSSDAAKLRRQATGIFVSEKKAVKKLAKAENLQMKADKLKTAANLTKAKMAKNRQMRAMFEKGLSEVNTELVTNGQNFLYRKENGKAYGMFDRD